MWRRPRDTSHRHRLDLTSFGPCGHLLQIAGFIFGKNSPVGAEEGAGSEKIAMTSPVRMEMVRGGGSRGGNGGLAEPWGRRQGEPGGGGMQKKVREGNWGPEGGVRVGGVVGRESAWERGGKG